MSQSVRSHPLNDSWAFVDGLMKDGHRIHLLQCLHGGSEIGAVAFRKGGPEDHKDVDPHFPRLVKHFETFLGRWHLGFVKARQIDSEGRNTHPEERSVAHGLVKIEIPGSGTASRQDSNIPIRFVPDQLEGISHPFAAGRFKVLGKSLVGGGVSPVDTGVGTEVDSAISLVALLGTLVLDVTMREPKPRPVNNRLTRGNLVYVRGRWLYGTVNFAVGRRTKPATLGENKPRF